jgi:hypothetical protein
MSKAPPVPPANRTNKGSQPSPARKKSGDLGAAEHQSEKRNLAEQDRQGNVQQNTRNQGYQQDR